MAGNFLHTAKKLQTACRQRFGDKLLLQQRQWFSNDRNMAVTVYVIQRVIIDKSSKKESITELFKTYSQVQLVLFMRDYWYSLNGWEIPNNNKTWEAIKERYGREQQPNGIEPVSKNNEP